jgi:hypothetical protein
MSRHRSTPQCQHFKNCKLPSSKNTLPRKPKRVFFYLISLEISRAAIRCARIRVYGCIRTGRKRIQLIIDPIDQLLEAHGLANVDEVRNGKRPAIAELHDERAIGIHLRDCGTEVGEAREIEIIECREQRGYRGASGVWDETNLRFGEVAHDCGLERAVGSEESESIDFITGRDVSEDSTGAITKQNYGARVHLDLR